MLAKSGRLPTRGEWAYEVKWDGFRAIVSTEGPLRVRSRRGWNMTEHVRFLEELPVRAVLDGELVAFGEDGKPDFERVCDLAENVPRPSRKRQPAMSEPTLAAASRQFEAGHARLPGVT